jgi:hypothetical protein
MPGPQLFWQQQPWLLTGMWVPGEAAAGCTALGVLPGSVLADSTLRLASSCWWDLARLVLGWPGAAGRSSPPSSLCVRWWGKC